jgi:hypothetical protein
MDETNPGTAPSPVRARVDALGVTAVEPPPLPRPSADYNPEQRRRLLRVLAAHERQVELAELEVTEASRAVSLAIAEASRADDALQRVLVDLEALERLIRGADPSERLIEQHQELTRRYAAARRELEPKRFTELERRLALTGARRKLHFFTARAADARRKLGRVAGLKR